MSRHHGIAYQISKSLSLDEALKISERNYTVSGKITNQCNGPISNVNYENNKLLVLVPEDYLKDINSDIVKQYISLLCDPIFKNSIVYHGTKNLKIHEDDTLCYSYNLKSGVKSFHVFMINEDNNIKNGKIVLALFSLIRSMYANIYKGYVETVCLLHELHKNEDLFKIFQAAILFYPSFNTYCGGGYHLLAISKNLIFGNNTTNVSAVQLPIFITFDEFIEKCTIKGINCSFMIGSMNSVNINTKQEFKKRFSDVNFNTEIKFPAYISASNLHLMLDKEEPFVEFNEKYKKQYVKYLKLKDLENLFKLATKKSFEPYYNLLKPFYVNEKL